jgi:hypothetical protein
MCFGNILGMNVIGSIMGAKLTTTALTIIKVNALADVQGTLCVEDGYDVLNAFVDQQPDKPGIIMYAPTADCVAALLNGDVAAVITDQTALAWYARHSGIGNIFVSPVLQSNPFAMVFANHSAPLRAYVDPAVTAATLTSPEWLPFTQALITKYFGKQQTYSDMGENPIHYPSLIAGAVLLLFPILIALINGDMAWDGLFKDAKSGWKLQFRKAIARPDAAEDDAFMNDKDGALQGHDLSFFRYAVTALEEVQEELAALKGWRAESAQSGTPQHGAPALPAPALPAAPAAASLEVMQLLQALMQEVREIKQTQQMQQRTQTPQPRTQTPQPRLEQQAQAQQSPAPAQQPRNEPRMPRHEPQGAYLQGARAALRVIPPVGRTPTPPAAPDADAALDDSRGVALSAVSVDISD